MNKAKRWGMAQDYEKAFWQNLARNIESDRADLKWYEWKARKATERLASAGVSNPDGFTVVEVGSGPVGMVAYLPGSKRYAVDPLMEYYETEASLVAARSNDVDYLHARGEALPLPDASCDLVVIDNCLDHCQDPNEIMRECYRVLRKGGALYLTLHVRTRVGRLVRSLMESKQLDPGHPYSYDLPGLRRTVAAPGFRLQQGWLQDWGSCITKGWKESRSKTVLKVCTLTIERLYEGVWTT